MTSIREIILCTDVSLPTDAQRELIEYLSDDLQKVFDKLVTSELGWKPLNAFNKHSGDKTRRMWLSNLGTLGNLSAARFLHEKGIDWKGALFGERRDLKVAA